MSRSDANAIIAMARKREAECMEMAANGIEVDARLALYRDRIAYWELILRLDHPR